MTRSGRALLLAITIAAAGVGVMTALAYLPRPLRADETDWPPQAQAIARRGVPIVTFAEDRLQHPFGYFGYDAHYGLYHPPMYEYLLTAGLLVIGDYDWMYRSVSILCLAFSLFMIWKLSRDALGAEAQALLLMLPVALPLLSPLVSDGGLLVDIDNTTLTASMAVVLWSFLRPGDRLATGRVIELSLVLLLAFLSKLTTPLVLTASLALYAALGPRPVRGVLFVVLAGAIAISMFALLYWLYCLAFDYPVWFMFEVNYLRRQNLFGSIKRLTDVLFAVRWNVVWVSPIVCLLLASVTLRRAIRYVRVRTPEPVDLLIIFAWATFCAYALVGGMIGKYTVPAALVAGAAIGLELAASWPALDVRRRAPFLVGLACLGALVAWLPIPYVRYEAPNPQAGFLASALDSRNVSALVIGAAAAALAAAGAAFWLRAGSRWRACEIALAACLVVVAPITAARVVLPDYDRSPLRPFSDRGYRATIAYLNQVVPPGTAIVAQEKDFARYFHGPVYDLTALLASGGVSAAMQVVGRPDVGFIVESAKYPIVREPRFYASLDIARVEAIGDFRVYVKR